MYRRGIETYVSCSLILLMGASCPAQETSEYSAQAQTDAYLAERGLDQVLAARLRERLRTAQGEDRTRVAESLGRVYARELERIEDPAARVDLEKRCRELIDSVPDVESFGLRIELARTMYLTVESDAEGARMMLNTPERDAEAVRVLKVVAPQFEQLTRRLQSECERLQRRVDVADDSGGDSLRERLEEYRGFRSRAAYYAGWSSYYLAMIEKDSRPAIDALEAFGVILGAVPGSQANLERVNKGFIRFPHYARSMIGCALSASLLGRDVEALRWLDAVAGASDLPADVESQLFVRYAIVLADAGRWSDLAVRTRVHRERADSATGRLSKAEARLVAVLALGAGANPGVMPRTKQSTEEIAQIALNDLVAAGEVAHVKDLFRRFGTAPIADQRFIAMYLRGSDAFEKSRQSHLELNSQNNEPATDASVITAYRATADLLKAAIGSADAGSYQVELSRARVKRGLALFFAGDLVEAADELENASDSSSVDEDRKEALWFSIVALDRAIRGGKVTLQERCDRLAAEYVRRYPGAERSVSLLARLVNSGLLDSDAAIQSLLEVASDSPMYLTARSEAVARLYVEFSRAAREERDFLALRVAEVGEDVLKRYYELAIQSQPSEAKAVAERLIVRARQIADALLSMSVPDADRASSVLALITSTADRLALDISLLEPEMCYHRFRIAIATDDVSESQRVYSRLITLSASNAEASRFLDAADSLSLVKTWERYRASGERLQDAREVIRIVGLIIGRSDGKLSDKLQGVYSKGAEAAHRVWSESADVSMMELAAAWDEKLVAVVRNAPSLRRLALSYDAMGHAERALQCWNEVLEGTPERSDAWYEARIGSIRVLLKIRPEQATEAIRQHRVLYPDPAPEPWRTRIDELEAICEERSNSAGGGG